MQTIRLTVIAAILLLNAVLVAAQTTAFVGVNIVPMDVITEIGDAKKVKVPKDAQKINASGKFLIPGLWDMHVHLEYSGRMSLPVFLANGVTGVRDMGGDFALIKRWRAEIESGALAGPRIKTSGPILENPQSIARYEKLMQISMADSRVGVSSPAEAAEKITNLKKLGVDFLKIRTHANRETFLAVAAEAKRLGLPLVGYAPVGVSLAEASDAGLKSIEHYIFVLGPNFTDEQWKETAAIFLKNKTYLVPTFISGRGARLTPDEKILAVIEDVSGTLDVRRKYAAPGLIEFWSKEMALRKNERFKLDYQSIEKKNFEIIRSMKRAGVMLKGKYYTQKELNKWLGEIAVKFQKAFESK
jgi:hypothetical protein